MNARKSDHVMTNNEFAMFLLNTTGSLAVQTTRRLSEGNIIEEHNYFNRGIEKQMKINKIGKSSTGSVCEILCNIRNEEYPFVIVAEMEFFLLLEMKNVLPLIETMLEIGLSSEINVSRFKFVLFCMYIIKLVMR